MAAASVSTPQLAFLNSNVVTIAPKTSVTASSLFAHATGGAKYFYGESSPITLDQFANVKITMVGSNDQGDPIQMSFTTAIAFGAYDNCSG